MLKYTAPPGTPFPIGPGSCKIPDPGARSVDDLLRQSAARLPRKAALSAMGATVSYRDLVRYSDGFAAWLRLCDLQAGERVAVALPNVMAHPIACLGIIRAGLTAVCVNPLYTARELSTIFRDSAVKAVVLFEPMAQSLQQALRENGIGTVVVVSPGDHLGWRRPLVNRLARKKLQYARHTIPNAVSWKAAISTTPVRPGQAQDAPEDQPALMLYSGGTTGQAKGVPITHGALVFNVAQQFAALDQHLRPLGAGDYTLLLAIPLYHILGFGNLLFSLARGGTTALISNPRDTAALSKEWRRHRVTSFPAVNTLFNSLMACQAFAKLDFSSLMLSLGAGMPVSAATAMRWHELTRCHITEAYGLTETGLVACNPPGPSRTGSVGMPVPGIDISLRDDDGFEIASGPGEICVRSPAIMKGYWNNQAENASAFTTDGFFRTGDIGVFDSAGFLRLLDRKKEMIISSGFKVFPSEIEQVLDAHPGVLESAVVPARDAHAGEVPIAYVVRRDTSVDMQDLLAWCERQLASYKRPRKIIFRQDLPKSNVGKILRKALIDADANQ